MRKTHDTALKVKVALEAVKGEKTITEIASEFSVYPNQISQWRAQLLERLPEMFSQRKSQNEKSQDELVVELFRQIGKIKVELDWLKKSRNSSCRKKANSRGTGITRRAHRLTMRTFGLVPLVVLLLTRRRIGIESSAHAVD